MTDSAHEERNSPRPAKGRNRRRRGRRRAHRLPTSTPPNAPETAVGGAAGAATTDTTATPATTDATKAADQHKQFSSAEEAPYAIVAIQATGIHPKSARMVSLGVSTADRAGNIVDTWHVVIDPTEDPGPTHLHGLQPSDFDGAPRFGVIQSKLAHALDGRTLIAHNAPMVWGFIVAEAKRARRQANRERGSRGKRGRGRRTRSRAGRIPAPTTIVDTLATARRQGVELEDTRLRGVARAYGLEVPSPVASAAGIEVPERVRTLEDVTTTLQLFLAQGGLSDAPTSADAPPARPIASMATDDLREDRVGLQRSSVRVDAMEAPRPVENPGRYAPGGKLSPGMEFVVAPEVTMDPDRLIAAGVRAGLAYSEKVTRESSLLVCNRPANVTPAELTGKAMHAHRKEIPLVSDEAFLRLVTELEESK